MHGSRLSYEIYEGNLDKINDILILSPELLRSRDQDGNTLLHLAVECQNEEIIKYFVILYPELLDIKNHAGMTPGQYSDHKNYNRISESLYFLAEQRGRKNLNEHVIGLLLSEIKATTSNKDQQKLELVSKKIIFLQSAILRSSNPHSIIAHLISSGNYIVASFLLNEKNILEELNFAIEKNSIEVTNFILKHPSFHLKDSRLKSLLVKAAKLDRGDILKSILEHATNIKSSFFRKLFQGLAVSAVIFTCAVPTSMLIMAFVPVLIKALASIAVIASIAAAPPIALAVGITLFIVAATISLAGSSSLREKMGEWGLRIDNKLSNLWSQKEYYLNSAENLFKEAYALRRSAQKDLEKLNIKLDKIGSDEESEKYHDQNKFREKILLWMYKLSTANGKYVAGPNNNSEFPEEAKPHNVFAAILKIINPKEFLKYPALSHPRDNKTYFSIKAKVDLALNKLQIANELLDQHKTPIASHQKKHLDLEKEIDNLKEKLSSSKESINKTERKIEEVITKKEMSQSAEALRAESVFFGNSRSNTERFQKRAEKDIELTGCTYRF